MEILSPDIFRRLSEEAISGSRNIAEESGSIQGILAAVSAYNYSDLEDDLAGGTYADKRSILVILDEITDVGNFGAILRNCSAFGANGVIISKNRSAEASNRVSKISSGALEEIKVYCVTNIVSAMNRLKSRGFWIYGTSPGEDKDVKPADSISYSFPLAVVFGSEQKGIRRLISENCDMLVKITMAGRMQSLNVSTSSGIMLYILNQFLLKNKKF